MSETELSETWAALDPTPLQRRRIGARLQEWLAARESSLPSEWLGLLRIRPISALSFTAVALCLVLVFTPLSWVMFSVL